MTIKEKHSEIKAVKYVDDLVKDQQSFDVLLNKLMLFSEDSEYYELSGVVTAALLDYDGDGITVLAINGPQWVTLRLNKERLINILNYCEAVIGNDPDNSFFIEKK